MNEAPEKIWVIRDRYVVDPEKSCERTVPYIHADLVDELVEALEKTAELVEILGYPAAKARAALKKLEEE